MSAVRGRGHRDQARQPDVIDGELLSFLVVATVLTVVPGADMALVARNVLSYGRRAGYVTSLGISAGLVIHAIASAVGLSAILMTSAMLFSAVKLLGAAYLVWLGVLSLRHALTVRATDGPPLGARVVGTSTAHGLVQGLLSNLLNPKVALFYLTLLPQFVRPGDAVLPRSLLLAAIHVAVGLLWLALYTYFLGRLGATLHRTSLRRWLEGITGAVLVGLGARLAWDRR
jgi:RhtB (resistance to homoserine/threonine) family protein